MDQKQVLKQMIDFNKAAYNNTFNAFVILQDRKLNFKRITDSFTSEDVGTDRFNLLGNTNSYVRG